MLLLRFTTRKINWQSSSGRLPGPPDSFTAELSRPASTTQPRIRVAILGTLHSPGADDHLSRQSLLRYRRIATMTKYYDFAVIFFLSHCGACASVNDSVRIRTDTALDQDCVLKANVHVCKACMIVSLLTTCLNLNKNETLPKMKKMRSNRKQNHQASKSKN